jgi:hypothetical protein
MCFSAEASLGVAAALLPAGGCCLAAAWHKDRAYLPLAAVPALFGLQQLCEASVWAALGRGDPGVGRVPSLAFLFFALAVWPVWVPPAVAAAGGDESRDNWLLGILALGEGWHNSHHAFPTSARHRLRWWQPDASYYLIRALSWVGLAWNVKVPTREVQARASR